MIIPHYYSIVSGIGKGQYPMLAFDNALCKAGIGDYNLVKVSSILPPSCFYKEKVELSKGGILFSAYARKFVKYGESGSVAVGVAIPPERHNNGVIFEASSSKLNAKEMVHTMCVQAMTNRSKKAETIRSKYEIIVGEPGIVICGIAAVIMW